MATQRNSIWYISRCKEAGNFNIFYIGDKLTIKHENKELKKKRDTMSRDKWEQKGCSTKTKKFIILSHRADVGYTGHFCTVLAILAEFWSRFHNILEMLKSPEVTCKCYVSIYEFFWENAQKFSSDSWPKIGAFCSERWSRKSPFALTRNVSGFIIKRLGESHYSISANLHYVLKYRGGTRNY